MRKRFLSLLSLVCACLGKRLLLPREVAQTQDDSQGNPIQPLAALLLASSADSAFKAIGGSVTALSKAIHRAAPAVLQDTNQEYPEPTIAGPGPRQACGDELKVMLKSAPLYVLGLGQRKNIIAYMVAKRLGYRFRTQTEVMANTYSAVTKKANSTFLDVVADWPEETTMAVSTMVLQNVQDELRTVHAIWEGCCTTADRGLMMQSVIVNVVHEKEWEADENIVALTKEDEIDAVYLPGQDKEATKKDWLEKHAAMADITVTIEDGLLPDDGAYKVMKQLIAHIKANPPLREKWKEKVEQAMKDRGEELPEGYFDNNFEEKPVDYGTPKASDMDPLAAELAKARGETIEETVLGGKDDDEDIEFDDPYGDDDDD